MTGETVTAYEWDKPTPEQLAARKRWVELLRSGEFEQLKGYLSTEDGKQRCCLGVACDPRVTGIDLAWELYVPGPGQSVRAYGDEAPGYPTRSSAFLPPSIVSALGLDDDLPWVRLQGGRQGLTWLNDHGIPFSEIADLIEATYITPHLTEG